jgi:hypothetical protein
LIVIIATVIGIIFWLILLLAGIAQFMDYGLYNYWGSIDAGVYLVGVSASMAFFTAFTGYLAANGRLGRSRFIASTLVAIIAGAFCFGILGRGV